MSCPCPRYEETRTYGLGANLVLLLHEPEGAGEGGTGIRVRRQNIPTTQDALDADGLRSDPEDQEVGELQGRVRDDAMG